MRRAYNDLGFGRGNVPKDGLSLKDDQIAEMAMQSMGRYLNNDNPSGSYSQIVPGSSTTYTMTNNYISTPPGINP